ncbi:nuclear transport factor 2 family protein [Spongiactinospora sp. TRM90649]|uniref:nuclear transport factor 2 family protein n=1 Tax=Spongiactinospora sp. TRM90649 TaxID=3031114 RepID=UPI0023F9EF72|nr:nuclear transport factor 2 family protein [Spongiactinospora sp. TRM90649]MDF5758852.1 nuclear transport factor 2 family protein [Spongiactinospora sp. TRM90649]
MQNIDIIAAHYAASARGDLDGMLAPFAPGIRWTEAEGSLYAGTYVGPDAVVANVFAPIGEQFERFDVEIDTTLDAGDRVVALGHYAGKHRGTGRAFRARMVHVWSLADGKVVAFEQVVDNAAINAAVAD